MDTITFEFEWNILNTFRSGHFKVTMNDDPDMPIVDLEDIALERATQLISNKYDVPETDLEVFSI